ncbi:MAG: hypothetical protein FWE85_02900 [Clostridiales bacterium]|nr:hypothetical protein [Clostridiales bacterium]
MARKLLLLGAMLIMALVLFAGCGGNKYNAVILDDFFVGFNEEFLRTTFGVENEPENSDEWWGDDDGADGWWNYDYNGKKLIRNQTLIIKDQSSADIAFDYFPSDFDFEKEMLLFCFFAESSQWIEPPSSYKIKNMRIDGSSLKFTIEVKAQASSAEGRFNQRCKIIKIEKLDITAAQFEKRTRK